ncbi:MFS transporter [Gemmobacter nanjingensis]|uniref:MFS transporter n=1 Tax=Gemmobacter nanjingensis TaxID=488454 RepID=A0ABQ3FFG2_9RHOB|nr:class I SAM-dependent methyltransferase [Gemmobacter nanjingensis]GHC21694.1 MFS transporter [Gemmobacter nanjingensis]
MRSTRLELALDTGAIALPPEGRIAVFRPRAGDDLSALPKARVQIITGFRPDHDHFTGLGYACATAPEGDYTTALICVPRARAEARALVATACAHLPPGALVILDGQKTDGIDTLLKDLRARVDLGEALAKAHGKIAAFPSGPDLSDWSARPQQVDGFTTLPGVFSADGPDRGSILLAGVLPAKFPSRVVDLGAGWGYLSRAVLTRDGVKELHLVEADHTALDCARLNIPDPRAHFHWADARLWQVPHLAGAVVCNPPFHTGREADPGLGLAFLKAAAKMLAPDGTLWLVANRHLPYDPALRAAFREVEEIGGDGAFRLVRASYPSRR